MINDLLDVCLRRGHHAKPPDTTILTYYPHTVCVYVCVYEWFGQSRGGEGADNTGEIRYLVFFAYLHGDGVEDCSMISDCSDLESNFFLSF